MLHGGGGGTGIEQQQSPALFWVTEQRREGGGRRQEAREKQSERRADGEEERKEDGGWVSPRRSLITGATERFRNQTRGNPVDTRRRSMGSGGAEREEEDGPRGTRRRLMCFPAIYKPMKKEKI